jgi:hypothetical protein
MLLYLPFLAARNRSRRNLKKFSEVVASLGPTAPGSPSQEYTFPASARIAVSSDIDVPAGTVSARVRPDGGIGGMSYKERAESCPLRIATDRNAREIEKLKEDLQQSDALDDQAWECLDAALTALEGEEDNPVPTATHYFNPSVVQPAWAEKMTPVANIGAHRFMREGGAG